MKYQVAIIGGGPAGYTAAEAAGKAGLSVVLFEKQSLGGVCLNEGCIPTKTLLYSAKTYDGARHAAKYAVSVPEVSFDLPKIIARKQKVVRKLVLGVKGKLTAHGVTIVSGEATVTDKNHVECGGETYECENLLLCTGSETFVPAIPGIDKVSYWTHRDALDNKELPASLAIIGGGVIGMEFASFFNSLGVQVTVVEMLDEILGGGMDRELAGMLRAEYAKRGIKFMLSAKVVSVMPDTAEASSLIQVNYETADGPGSVVAERLLMSVGNERLRIGESGLGKNGARKCLCQRTDADFSSRSICLRRLDGIFLAGAYSRPRGGSSHTFHHWQEGCHELPCHPRRGIYQSRNSRCGRDRRIPAEERRCLSCREAADGVQWSLCSRE